MTKRRIKRIVWIVGTIAIVGFLIAVFWTGGEAPPPPGQQPVVLHGGQVRGNRISSRSWSFDYKRAETSPDGTIATIDGVKHGVLYKNGKPYLTLSAEHVSVNTQTFDFTATGVVHIEDARKANSARRSFDTDLVQWVNVVKTLTLPHPSLIRTGDQILKVETITVDFNKTEIKTGKIDGAVAAP